MKFKDTKFMSINNILQNWGAEKFLYTKHLSQLIKFNEIINSLNSILKKKERNLY